MPDNNESMLRSIERIVSCFSNDCVDTGIDLSSNLGLVGICIALPTSNVTYSKEHSSFMRGHGIVGSGMHAYCGICLSAITHVAERPVSV